MTVDNFDRDSCERLVKHIEYTFINKNTLGYNFTIVGFVKLTNSFTIYLFNFSEQSKIYTMSNFNLHRYLNGY